MSYNFRYSEEAEIDIFDSYLFYERKKLGLGEDFLMELEYAKRAILISPFTYRVVFKNKIRVFIIQRFPYSLYYIINGSNIDVISVFNTNQNPMKWKERLG